MDPRPDPLPPPPRAARRLRWAALAIVVLVGVAVAGGLAWLWRSTDGLTTIVRVADRLLPARLEIRGASGSLADGFGFDELVYETEGLLVRVERLQARLAGFRLGLELTALRFDFDELLAERLVVLVRPATTPSSGIPASIASPVTVTARRLAVGVFDYRTAPEPEPTRLQLRAIDTRAAIGPDGYQVTDGRLAWGPARSPLQVRLSATLGGARPFALDGSGDVTGSLQERPLRAAVKARGSLADLLLEAEVTRDPGRAGGAPPDEQPRGRLAVRLASFESPVLRELVADFERIDPAAWVEGAPQASLTVHAELRPQPGARFTVRGPVAIRNAAPGTLDRGRLPVASLRAQVEATAERLRFDRIAAELTRGSARGEFEIGLARLDAWRAGVAFSGVDPAALHGALRPFSVDGEARVVHEGGDTAIIGTARSRTGPPLQADVDLRASRARVLVNTAQLTLGKGRAMIGGEVQLSGSRALRLTGSVVELDPALLVSGVQARLTGTFDASGVLAPRPAGTVTFALSDSQILGRPVVGRGALSLDADQQLDIDATLGVRNATLTARGGLGAAGRTLALELVAPQLRDLGLPLAGRLNASARLSGAWKAPAIDAQVEAGALAHGIHRVEEFQAIASYSGGSDGRLAVQASLSNHRLQGNPMLSLQTASLQVDGTLADHRLELRASNEEAQPLGLEVAGGWRQHEPKAAAEWRGEIRSAHAGRPFDLKLAAPLPVRTDFSRWAIGPLDLSIAGARVEQARVDIDRGVLSTAGRFSEFRPSELRGSFAPGRPLARGAAPHVPTTLRGSWELRLGAQADGSLLIERSGGDILAGTTPMGISDLRLSAELRANKLQAEARLLGSAAGRADARLTAEVEHGSNGWRLAQQRPLAATLDVDLPSLAWVNSLLSERVRANVRTGGSLKGSLKVDGTPAEPVAAGSFSGSGLRLAWIEQGIRLESGTLAARVDGATIVLDELRFAASQQVQPADRRAAQAYAREKPAEQGFLAMTGQLQLRDLSGVLQVQAVHMPFLQRPDRWVVATGGANIVFDQKRVQLNGAATANAGYVDFSRSNLPSLSSDVQVVRAAEPAAASREAPVGLDFDLGIDLGPAFYLRGAGLDTQIEGQVRLRAERRGAIRATGTLQARDGIFEGFGQRLEIERGRVNLQGPLDNPGLDVLALRRGLPVDVGVAVTRTAQNPLIKLYSAEPMPDQEILSWLVLGRAAGETDGGQDRVALATAAASILAGGEGVGSQFARRFGVDEFSLRTGEMASTGSLLPRTSVAGNVRGSSSTATEEIVTVGKRLSDNITLSFEQAAGGAESLVQVVYRLTKQVSILARAGTENALDVVYTITFD